MGFFTFLLDLVAQRLIITFEIWGFHQDQEAGK
jgi:hypothetical protein